KNTYGQELLDALANIKNISSNIEKTLNQKTKPSTMGEPATDVVELMIDPGMKKKIEDCRIKRRIIFWRRIRDKAASKIKKIISNERMYNLQSITETTEFVSLNLYNDAQAN